MLAVFGLLLFWPLLALAETDNNTPQETAPYEVDIVVEAGTYTPYFYQGRSEPTAGNQFRLIAIVDLPATESYENLQYTWEVSGQVFTNSASLTTLAPMWAEAVPVRLKVRSADGQLLAESSQSIHLSEPSLVFYENSSLRGVSRLAVGDELIMIGTETAVRAEPYFMGANDSEDTFFVDWTINGQPTITAGDWGEMDLIMPPDQVSEYQVSLSISHRKNLAQSASKTFRVIPNI